MDKREFHCLYCIETTNLYILWKNGGNKQMRLYKSFLVVVLLVAIGWGVWYCISNYNDKPSEIDGTLVYEIKECPYVATNNLY